MKSIKTSLVLVLLQMTIISYGQELLGGSGDSYSSGSIRLDFSLGELAITTQESSQATLTQGFHQSKLKIIPLFVEQTLDDFRVKIYPNPAREYFQVEIPDPGKYILLIHDLNGRLVKQSQLEGTKSQVDMTTLSDGTYSISLLNAESNQKRNYILIKRK